MPSLPTPVDVFRAARAQTEAMAALPGALLSLTRAVAQLDATMREVRAAVGRLQRIGERLEGVLDEIEQPVRDLAPGLARVAAVLDDPVVSQIPDTVRRIREDVLPLVATLRGTSDMLDRFPGLSLLAGRRRPEPPAATPPAGTAVLPGGVPDE